MKTRGMVLEVEKTSVLVITRDGQFRRLPRRGHVEVGSVYSYGTSFPRSQLAVAAVLLLAMASVLLPLQNQPVPVAYVTVDINPSLELTVSASQKVIGTQGLNEDGARLLEGLRLRGKPLTAALELILEAAAGMKYMDENPLLIITGTPADNGGRYASEIENKLAGVAEHLTESTPQVAVAILSCDPATRAQARELGLSTGKYAVYLQAQNQGLELTVAALQRQGIGKALLDLDVLPGEMLRRVGNEKNLIALAQQVKERNQTPPDAEVDPPDQNNGETPDDSNKPKPPKPSAGKKDKGGQQPADSSGAVQEPQENGEADPGQTVVEAVYGQQGNEEPIMKAEDIEPEFEEARRGGLWGWFMDLFVQENK